MGFGKESRGLRLQAAVKRAWFKLKAQKPAGAPKQITFHCYAIQILCSLAKVQRRGAWKKANLPQLKKFILNAKAKYGSKW